MAGLVAGGLTNHEIATPFRVADGTVKRHVEDILTRLGLETRAQTAVRAVQNLNYAVCAFVPSASVRSSARRRANAPATPTTTSTASTTTVTGSGKLNPST